MKLRRTQINFAMLLYRHGAQEVAQAEAVVRRNKPGSSKFGGTGYKLGDKETEPSETAVVAATAGAATGGLPEARDVVLRLWSTGFTIDDGQLRAYSDPANVAFLNSVKKGEVPQELVQEFRGQEVQLTMEDRRTEDYVPPKKAVRAFAGFGQMLGRLVFSVYILAYGIDFRFMMV